MLFRLVIPFWLWFVLYVIVVTAAIVLTFSISNWFGFLPLVYILATLWPTREPR